MEYSYAAQVARAYLLATFNDIIVFVEDVSCANMYVAIINNTLGDLAKVNHVFPLGNRDSVIEAARNFQARKIPRPCIFLIDGDLDLLAGIPAPSGPPLYRIRVYCVENLILSERALVEVAFESDAEAPREQIAARLRFSERMETAARLLRLVFEMYAAAYLLDAPEETVSYAVVRLLDRNDDPDSLSVKLCAARRREIRRALVARYGWNRVTQTLVQVRGVSRSKDYGPNLLSGKSYLFPLIARYLSKEFNFRDSSRSLRVRLARFYDPAQQRELSEVLRGLVRPAA